MGIKVLQTNLGRARMPHDLAYALATKRNFDILVVGEPNKRIIQNAQWIKDKREDVAMLFLNKSISVREVTSAEGHVRVQISDCHIYCCYLSPNIGFEDFRTKVDAIMEDVGRKKGEKLIIGDINAKSPLWGSPHEDRRGEYWCEWLAALDLVVVNDGKLPTFIRGNAESYIDVTCATKYLYEKISDWKVLQEEPGTEHQYISFEIKSKTTRLTNTREVPVCDWTTFKEIAAWKLEDLNATENIESIVKESYKASTTRIALTRIPFWWNEDINSKRKECLKIRREATRLSKNTNREDNEKLKLYKAKKKELKSLIVKSKNKNWEDLCNDLENDIWGKAYKVATKKLIGCAPYQLHVKEKVRIARTLFPIQEKTWKPKRSNANAEPFTQEEYRDAIRKLRNGTAPGTDGVPIEAIKKLEEVKPCAFLDLMNKHLAQQSFPREWKTAKLVLIPKGKPENQNYRPICLLSSFSKFYESLLKSRLEGEIEALGSFSDNQFGFRKSRSTIQAVEKVVNTLHDRTTDRGAILITLDVKNAFNTVAWDLILSALHEKGISAPMLNIINSYLEDRSVMLDKKTKLTIYAGVPQGSILGPLLWNFLYDGVLNLVLPEGVSTIAYADDLAVVVTARNKQELQWKANESLEQIGNWMRQQRLELAPQKTECVILRGERSVGRIQLVCEGMEIHPKKYVTYLGVIFGQGCNYGEHLKVTTLRAEERAGQLMRVTGNIRGPSYKKKLMLYNVVQSILLYGAPIWYEWARKTTYERKLIKAQRKFLIRVCSAYRTVSSQALQVIAGVPPIRLLVEERESQYRERTTKTESRETTLKKWQSSWSTTLNVAQWTREMIPRIDPWVKCGHRRVDYYLTQVLTGHGSFQSYTRRIGKTSDDLCRYCREVDTVEHTLFQCPRWEEGRRRTSTKVGTIISLANMTALMTNDREAWDHIHTYIKDVMMAKEKDERASI